MREIKAARKVRKGTEYVRYIERDQTRGGHTVTGGAVSPEATRIVRVTFFGRPRAPWAVCNFAQCSLVSSTSCNTATLPHFGSLNLVVSPSCTAMVEIQGRKKEREIVKAAGKVGGFVCKQSGDRGEETIALVEVRERRWRRRKWR